MAALAFHPTSFENYQVLSQAQNPNRSRQIDLASFNELVLTYQDVVFRQALWILGDEAAAEDATQEAFLRAYCKIDTFNGGPFKPWILRIAVNYCYDQLRRQKVRRTLSLESYEDSDHDLESNAWMKDTSTSVEESYEREEDQARLNNQIRRLSPEFRSAILLVDIEGMDYLEAAQTLGIPLGTFKSRLSRARQQLQVSLLKSGFSRSCAGTRP